jgi:hypothetical protein
MPRKDYHPQPATDLRASGAQSVGLGRRAAREANAAAGTTRGKGHQPGLRELNRNGATFTPSPAQVNFLHAWLDPKHRTFREAAKALGLNYKTVHAWHQQPGFQGWWQGQMDAVRDAYVGPVAVKLASLALAGSAKHAELFLQLAGKLAVGASAGAGVVQVVIGVPRPAQPQPGIEAPEPLTIDVAPGLPVSMPAGEQ